MKERTALFSGPMVRAILEGRKTQTRRLVNMRKYPAFTRPEPMRTNVPGETVWMNPDDPTGTMCMRRCPFGVPGDRLWVRETWQAYVSYGERGELFDLWEPRCEGDRPDHIEYLATVKDGHHPPRWRPSIHMPRWASRITLEVVSVRVERLQEIREEDAIAEGAERNVIEGAEATWTPEMGYRLRCCHYPEGCECFPHATARDWFAEAWESMYGEGAWAANPWVWVVEFKVVKPETAGGG